MDQATLSSNQPHLPDVHQITKNLAEQKRRPPLLRRVSQSDPNFQREDTPPPKFDAFQHVLHGIAEVNSGLSLHKLGFDNDSSHLSVMPLDQSKSSSAVPSALETHKPELTIERKLSEFNLGIRSNDPNSSLGSIKKAASFIHGTNFGLGSTSPYYPSHHTANFSIGGGSHFPSSTVSTPPVIEEPSSHHSGGLIMQIGSSAKTNNSLAVNTNDNLQHSSSMAGGLFSNSGTDTAANNTHVGGLIPNNNSTNSLTRNKSGVMGMFGRGFFAKPVIRSEEENYRYIMALDR